MQGYLPFGIGWHGSGSGGPCILTLSSSSASSEVIMSGGGDSHNGNIETGDGSLPQP